VAFHQACTTNRNQVSWSALEIACLVQGRTSASVIVAATPAATWAQASPLLVRAAAAYQVR
jgi:hypothetical protein